MHRRALPALQDHANGFTLIETMVALIVLSVGMIGVAALHGRSLSATGAAIHQSQAIALAGDMADRIRINRGAGADYAGEAADFGCDAATGDGGHDCSEAEMAAHDLFVWENQVADSLPGGQGTVAVDMTTNPTSYTVAVSWNEPSSEDPVTFSFTFKLPAY
jgi:type IV pilus assembly protein PilV